MASSLNNLTVSEILETAHEIGKNGHPLNTELLTSQINELILEARIDEFEEIIDYFEHSNLLAFEGFIKAHRHNLKALNHRKDKND